MGYMNKAKPKVGQFGGVAGPPGPTGLPGPSGPPGPAGTGFTLSATGNFDLQSKKLENVSAATNGSDAVVKSQVFVADGNGNLEMDRKQIKNLTTDESVASCAVNMATLRKHSATIGDIDLQEKYNVLNSKQRNLNELKTHYDSLVSFEEVKQNFLSRVETFAMGTTLDMNSNVILNLKDPKLGKEPATKDYADTKLSLSGGRMTGSINMGTYEITNLANPTGNSSAATKSYVDTEDAKHLPKAGGTMSGAINMGTSKITNLGNPTGNNDAATKAYADANLPKAGGTMSGAINMGTSKITNLGEPTANSDAATKHFVEQSHISQSGMSQNVFLYQMQDVLESSAESNITVNGILAFPNTPHTLFKKAYNFDIGKSALNEYNARIGFNFYQLPVGTYTYVVEYFPPTMTNVSVDCRSTPLNVNKQIFKQFPTYVKNIVQIHKWTLAAPDYLMVDIKSNGVASSPAKGRGWMIVYGIEGTHNDVSSSVLDTPFLISGGSMLMQVPLDMRSQVIQNLPLPTGATQAASKEYVDISGLFSILGQATATYVDGYIKENAECLYSVERGTKAEVTYTASSRAILNLNDQTLSGLNATQSVLSRRPILSTTKNAKRFYFTFNGTKRMTSLIDMNPASGASDIVHVFMLFRLATHAGSDPNFRNGLFGHDNGGWDKFACFVPNTNNLIIAGANKDGSEAHTGFNVQVTANEWQSKANASELNKWCCLSIHWDVPGGAKKSSCWVNGKKVKSFTSRTSLGSNRMTFGDINPNGGVGLNGDVQLFLLYKGFGMSELIIKAHHKMICERYGVDHDKISFP